jgi:hypothetical protein
VIFIIMDLYYPLLNKSFETTSGFGQRGTGKHSGVDLKADSGTRVVSIADGEVFKSDDTSDPNGYGGQILIKHLLDGKPYYSKYAHLRKRYVRVGETVTAGEKIGESGGGPNDPNKGRSTGPHLHFEILDGGKKPIDPEPILTGAVALGGAVLLGSVLSGKNKDKNKKNNNNSDGDDDGLVKDSGKSGFDNIMNKFLNVYTPVAALASLKGLTTPKTESKIPKEIMEEIQNFKRLIK